MCLSPVSLFLSALTLSCHNKEIKKKMSTDYKRKLLIIHPSTTSHGLLAQVSMMPVSLLGFWQISIELGNITRQTVTQVFLRWVVTLDRTNSHRVPDGFHAVTLSEYTCCQDVVCCHPAERRSAPCCSRERSNLLSNHSCSCQRAWRLLFVTSFTNCGMQTNNISVAWYLCFSWFV